MIRHSPVSDGLRDPQTVLLLCGLGRSVKGSGRVLMSTLLRFGQPGSSKVTIKSRIPINGRLPGLENGIASICFHPFSFSPRPFAPFPTKSEHQSHLKILKEAFSRVHQLYFLVFFTQLRCRNWLTGALCGSVPSPVSWRCPLPCNGPW